MTAADETSVSDAGNGPKFGPFPAGIAYAAALVASALLLLTTGLTEVLPWPAALLGVAAIAATKIEGSPWVPLGGGILFAVIVVAVTLSGVGQAGYAERLATQVPASEPGASAPTPAKGSLGLQWGEVPERWNSLGLAPTVTGGLIRETESGPYDSFRYRFDDAAVLAGAFDREDGTVHVLLGSVGLFHETAPNLYLHLCFMLHPYSQECIDAYLENGLAGKELGEFAGVDHEAQWELGDQLWKLEIAGDVQTIRVLSESAR